MLFITNTGNKKKYNINSIPMVFKWVLFHDFESVLLQNLFYFIYLVLFRNGQIKFWSDRVPYFSELIRIWSPNTNMVTLHHT